MFQISNLEPKKHKKISIVFGEGLQILVFRKVYLGVFYVIQGFYQPLTELGQLN